MTDDIDLMVALGISDRGEVMFKIGEAMPIFVPPGVARDIGRKIIATADAIEGCAIVEPVERPVCLHPRKSRKRYNSSS